MSYDISLVDPVTRTTLLAEEPHHMAGGTYATGGTRELELKFYYRPNVFGENGIRSIYGKTGTESIPILEQAIAGLGDDVTKCYWDATEGNAKRPLFQLLAMARMRPDGIWGGD